MEGTDSKGLPHSAELERLRGKLIVILRLPANVKEAQFRKALKTCGGAVLDNYLAHVERAAGE